MVKVSFINKNIYHFENGKSTARCPTHLSISQENEVHRITQIWMPNPSFHFAGERNPSYHRTRYLIQYDSSLVISSPYYVVEI